MIRRLIVLTLLLIGITVSTLLLLKGPKTYKSKAADKSKSPLEEVLNPFGDPWSLKKATNPNIPIALGACFNRFGRISKGNLNLSPEEEGFISKLNHPFIYFDQCPVIEDDSPKYRIISNKLKSINPDVKIIGYYIINFIERSFAAGVSRFKEEWYIHKKGLPITKENRLKIGQEAYLLDVTNHDYQLFVANALANAMEKNLIDGVLIDGSGQTIPLTPSNGTKNDFPDYYVANYKEGMITTLGEIKKALTPKKKLVFYNPLTPEGPYNQTIDLTKWFLSNTDGVMWEEPFRDDWRDVADKPSDYYYSRITEFLNLATSMNKYILIVQNTHLNQPPYNNLSPCSSWHCAFKSTNKNLERKYARYYLSFYLNFFVGDKTPLLYYTPTQSWDIFSSETFFTDWDTQIGKPKGISKKIKDHIYRRVFENAEVWLNNSDQPYQINLEKSLTDLEGIKATQFIIQPKSGMIYTDKTIILPTNPPLTSKPKPITSTVQITSLPSTRYTISGVAFIDTNKNAKVDPDEKRLSGKTITLSVGANKATTTNNSGEYGFSKLPAGTYRVTHLIPKGYQRTTDDSYYPVKLSEQEPLQILNFGIVPN